MLMVVYNDRPTAVVVEFFQRNNIIISNFKSVTKTLGHQIDLQRLHLKLKS